ncbi:NUDIX domain-containing protein [Tamlana sp. 2_MG-2023]|uniref:NUDIX hydrolase n=1 Tax=unclassified Tamlana TaxID=2614803 RepID=UPI0026E17161|nr:MULTISPECIES: NUDIX domain-containing protein [unclassified Tamlana]MDO6759993.1 NUDIX domain-containing protein [Tamlana sp. 2_MG-2023]MDO6791837.1 NUDIX domain-containing protein [Tamlana sp. 1_MG-2023]
MLNNYSKEDKVLLAVDCIIFGFDGEDLKILLIKRDFEPEKGKWSLIGGFLKNEENLDQAATRVLSHLTGLDNVYMEQFYAFSKLDRDPEERTISVAYYALIDIDSHNNGAIHLDTAKWFSLKNAPNLIFDHDRMVERAVSRLKHRTKTKPIGFELLPEKFTMLQLQNLYESILNKKLDKRNFTSKINALDILIKLKEKDMESSKKGSYLYNFDSDKYHEKLKEGFVFKI